MTTIEQFRPRYPMLHVYRGLTVPDHLPVWVWDYFMDDGGGFIVSTTAERPSLHELRTEWDCRVIIDDED
jgi:hypothetical protein